MKNVAHKPQLLQNKKRPRETIDIVAKILASATDGWQNSVSLSLRIWKLVSGDSGSLDIVDTFRQIAAYIQNNETVTRFKIRILTKCEGVPVVYVPTQIHADTLAEDYANRLFRKSPPVAVAPPPAASKRTLPTMRALVVDALPAGDRAVAFEVLINHWVDTLPLQPWQDIVWRKVSERRTHTVVDVSTTLPPDHPIWPLVRVWLAAAVSDPVLRTSPPEFPVPRDLDPRRAPAIPEGFGALSLDAVWKRFEGTVAYPVLVGHQIKFALGRGAGSAVVSTVHPERIAYWQHLAVGRVWFTYSELVILFGWQSIRNDAQMVNLLARALLAEAPVGAWFNRASNPQTYSPSGVGSAAIGALRDATTVVTCLTNGGLSSKDKMHMVFNLREKTQALDA